MGNRHEDFIPLTLSQFRIADTNDNYYLVFKDEKDFVQVEAETASLALESSNIAKPYKILHKIIDFDEIMTGDTLSLDGTSETVINELLLEELNKPPAVEETFTLFAESTTPKPSISEQSSDENNDEPKIRMMEKIEDEAIISQKLSGEDVADTPEEPKETAAEANTIEEPIEAAEPALPTENTPPPATTEETSE